MKEKNQRIVVTGIGNLTPIGCGPEDFWNAMKEGKSGSAPITYFDPSNFVTKFACELKGFDVKDYIDFKAARRMDRYTQYGVAAAEMAIRDSQLDLKEMDLTRFGVIFGSGIGGMTTYDDQFRIYMENGPTRISPFFIPMLIPDIAAGQISIRNGLMGPNYATVSACATSLHAIIDAYMILKLGFADYMVCGGAEAPITQMGIAGFNASRAISTRNDSPETASRPYDKDRDGFVMGEGSGALILETLASAEARGAKIYGEIAGVGFSADANHLTAPHPEGKGAIIAMSMALKEAEISVDEIDYVNTHGTSTPLGDLAELKAVKSLLGEHVKNINISSTKSMIGHLLGAAGVVESAACLLAIQNQIVPPTINIENLDPEVDVDVTPNQPKAREINYVLNNGFGFGGHNATLIFKKV